MKMMHLLWIIPLLGLFSLTACGENGTEINQNPSIEKDAAETIIANLPLILAGQ